MTTNHNLHRRLARLEANVRPDQVRHHVIVNTGTNGSFLGQHGRFMTDAEMDAAEAALFATGAAKSGEDVVLVVFQIVDPVAVAQAVLR